MNKAGSTAIVASALSNGGLCQIFQVSYILKHHARLQLVSLVTFVLFCAPPKICRFASFLLHFLAWLKLVAGCAIPCVLFSATMPLTDPAL